MKPVRNIVIVGGGSAGWITACVIAAKHRSSAPDGVRVTLIESPSIKTVGVGEGTWPTMRSTLLKIGISESDFLRECGASFKQGAKFAKWVTGAEGDAYYHPLVLPQGFPKTDLSRFWQTLAQKDARIPQFSDAVCAQDTLCENHLAPKLITTPEYASVANYAYHLDNGKFGEFLRRHGIEKLGITHILDDVTGVQSDQHGDISTLSTKENGPLSGDLFVDCTGFSSLLLGKHFGVAFNDCSDVLFIDQALAIQVPYPDDQSPIVSHTVSTGQTGGWIWDIGLQNQRGIGHVYSSQHVRDDTALQELGAYIGDGFDESLVRKIPIRSGHRDIAWKNNCVAVGLSAGFLEPLEASALVLVELSASMIADQLPARREIMDIVSKRFNQVFQYRWARIIEFLKLHYILSKREEPFWVDNRNPESIPERLTELLQLWRYHPPGDHDFDSNNEVFPAASYLYVLLGMGFEMDLSDWAPSEHDQHVANQEFQRNAAQKQKWRTSMPTNRELLNKVHEYGFQSV